MKSNEKMSNSLENGQRNKVWSKMFKKGKESHHLKDELQEY